MKKKISYNKKGYIMIPNTVNKYKNWITLILKCTKKLIQFYKIIEKN